MPAEQPSARYPLSVFFTPHTVAVIGASEAAGSVGRSILWNLVSNPFGGTVFPVNPNRTSVLGIKAYPTIADVPEPVDLAVVVTPAPTVPEVIGACAAAGVKGAIIISAGFRESGPAGVELERQTLAAAGERLRLIGPNCLGLMRPRTGLNATFASKMAQPGSVAFISQSGAMCNAVLDWSLRERVGFSLFASIGSMLDIGWGDLIDYLGDDPQTNSIVMYMESVGDARAFISAAREVALSKPIIVIKGGSTKAAAQAAASHTGALVGSDAVLDAVFRRCGVLRVSSVADLFAMAEVLATQPRPLGPRLTILTNSGGAGVLATDALVGAGGQLAELSPETSAALETFLPPHWSHANPIDILGDADPERFGKAIEIVAADRQTDGLLVILTPQAVTNPTATAERLQTHARKTGKPLLASWMGGEEIAPGEAILQRAGIPAFAYPDTAARAFQYMWQYSSNLRSLYETPALISDDAVDAPDRAFVEEMLRAARAERRTLLTEPESKQLIAAYGIPVVQTLTATTADEAVAHADAIGYPVAVKLVSRGVAHKTDVRGVRLHLPDAPSVRRAYTEIQTAATERAGPEAFEGVSVQPMVVGEGVELILGSAPDPQFGPVMLFGAGGHLVEVLRDRALALPPLNTTLARRMMERTRIFEAIDAGGRAPVDLAALERLVVRFSQLVAEQPSIKEIDINPLLATPGGFTALDARVILHDADTPMEQLPGLAIRPYPAQYVAPWALKDGTPIVIRPIQPEDEPLMVGFHQTLSEESVYYRFFRAIDLERRISHERLTKICFLDYDREIALVAVRRGANGEPEIVGIGRLTKQRSAPEAEFALLISDVIQGQGLGTELLRRLVQIGRDERLKRIVGFVLPENSNMVRVSKRLGFRVRRSSDIVEAIIDL